jgi:hypothetical protein
MIGHGCSDTFHQSGEVACLIEHIHDVGGGNEAFYLLEGINCNGYLAENFVPIVPRTPLAVL